MATDAHGRRIDYLRISVTDRCNLKCRYCMPAGGVTFKPHGDILSYEEIVRFTRIATQFGFSKIRLTGGEPLVREGVVGLVRDLHRIEGVRSLALTTNGTLLPRYAGELHDAGLRRVNISLDSLDPEVFSRVTRGGSLDDALAGVEAALRAGFDPVKLNVVVVRSLDQDLLGFARLTLDHPLHVRFIEYMPVGEAERGGGCHADGENHKGRTPEDSVGSDEVLARLAAEGMAAGLGELSAVRKERAPGGWGPARYYRFGDAPGTIGVISPLSHHFCGECNRLRLTADGRLRPCLFSDHELDVRSALRFGDDRLVRRVVAAALAHKPASHDMRLGTGRGMSQIGG